MSAATSTSGLATRIADVLAVDPEAPAIEFEGSWWSWAQLADTVAQSAALVPRPAPRSACCCATGPLPSDSCWGCWRRVAAR